MRLILWWFCALLHLFWLVLLRNIPYFSELASLCIVYICIDGSFCLPWCICPISPGMNFPLSCIGWSLYPFSVAIFYVFCSEFFFWRFLFRVLLFISDRRLGLVVVRVQVRRATSAVQGILLPITCFQWATSFAAMAFIFPRTFLWQCLWMAIARLFGMCISNTNARLQLRLEGDMVVLG